MPDTFRAASEVPDPVREGAASSAAERDERFRQVLRSAMDGFWLVDATGRLTMANERYAEMSGYSVAELQGMRVGGLDARERPEETAARIRRVMAQGADRFETWHRRKDGTEFEVEVSVWYLAENGGYFSVFVRDITAIRRAEREAEAGRQMLLKLAAQVPGVIYQYRWYPDGRSCFPFSSEGIREIYEVTPEEVREDATPVFHRLHPDDRQPVTDWIVESARTLEIFDRVYRVVLPRQGLRWRHCHAAPERLADGSTLWHGLITDITARKEAEHALRESEERFRLLFEGTPDPVFVHGADGRILDVNRAACRSLGYSKAELLARRVGDIEQTFTEEGLQELWSRIRSDQGVTVRGVHRRRDGTEFPVELHIAPYRHGPERAFFAAVRDLTGRVAAERALRLQGGALEAAANAVAIADAAGRIEWTNPAYSRLSGWAPEECRGRDLCASVCPETHEPDFVSRIRAAMAAGRVWQGEVVNRRRDGSRWTEEMTVTPLRDDAGIVSHFVAIKQDITERKRLERRFLQGQRMEAMGRLAGGIAHDLNNILAPLLMIPGMLRDRLPDPGDRELLDIVQNEARRGGEIIKQLLAFTRGVDGPRTIVQPRYVLAELLRVLKETFPREIELVRAWESGLWPVPADPTQLHQVLLNLCINARDAMGGSGRLTLAGTNVELAAGDARLPADAAAGPYVRLDVTDTGPGVPPELRERIFEPFFTTKPIGQGSGLGLSTVLGIVRSHRGFVLLDTEPGNGCSFRVYLPAVPGEAVPAAAAAASVAPAGGGRLILVVDDEASVRDTVRPLLERYGFAVVTAENGEEGLVRAIERADELRLVVTDLMMPTMGGVALIRQLREMAPRVPVVAMSGLTDAERAAELTALGVAEVVAKPFELVRMLEAVKRALGGN